MGKDIFEPELVGRKEEIQDLRSFYDRCRDGKGSTVFISGEAGIGKTRLVEELMSYAEDSAKVIQGWCLTDSLDPLMPVKEALRDADLSYLISESPPPKVISIFLIDENGLLITRAQRGESELDPDIFASMLSAVENFIADSLSMMDEERGQINSIEYGDYEIVIQSEKELHLTAIIKGDGSEFLLDDMRKKLVEINQEFGSWTGDMEESRRLKPFVDWFIESGKYEGEYLVDDPKLRKENLLESLLIGLKRLSTEKPLILFIDDLQWSDPSTLNLLHYLSRNTKEDRIMMLGTYRPEDIIDGLDGQVHPLSKTMQIMNREGLYHEIQLDRLTEEDVDEFMEKTLGALDIPERLLARIYRESEGNPFFLLELIQVLVGEEHLIEEDGMWRTGEHIDDVHIPSKVYDVVTRRLERLLDEQREVLECASVVGEEFESKVLASVTQENRIKLLKNLNAIERIHKLIHSLGKKYKFDHSKIREILYTGLNQELREEYHRIIAESYEAIYDDPENALEQIGHHYHMAKDPRGIEYLTRLGDKAREGYSNEEAVDYYQSALSLMDDEEGEEYKGLNVHLGDLYNILGEYDKALKNYEDVLAVEEREYVQADMINKISMVYLNKGDFDGARVVADRGLRLVEDESVERGRLLSTKAESYNSQGDYDEARELLLEHKSIVDNLDVKEDKAEVLKNLGISAFRQSDYNGAIEYLEKAVKISQELDDIKMVADGYQNLGLVYGNMEEIDRALDNYEIALDNYQKIGDIRGVAYVYKSMGVAHRIRGDYDRALEYQCKSKDIAKRIGDIKGLSSTYQNIGILYYDKGKLEKTLVYFEKASKLMEYIGDKQGVAWSYNNMGVLYNILGDLDRSLESHEKSLELKSSMGDTFGETSSLYNLGTLYYDMGDYDKSEEYHRKSLGLCEELDEKVLTVENNCFLSKICMERGEKEKALELAEKALKMTRETGVKQVEGISLLTYGQALMMDGELDEAEEIFQEAEELFESSGDKKGMAELYYHEGLLQIERGEERKALELLKKSQKMFKEASMKLWQERVKRDLKELE
ncbi:MAG: tetratricopeptide repeat protein [Thermoplasmata archaeon]